MSVAAKARANARARAGDAVQPGFDEDTPMLLGEEGGQVVRIRMLRTEGNLTVGGGYWVTGTGVGPLIASGAAADITKRAQKRRVFQVGGTTTTDKNRAERVSAATGLPVVEIA